MEGVIYVFIVFLLISLLSDKYVNGWLKLTLFVYYGVIIFYFSRGYSKIMSNRVEYASNNEYDFRDKADVKALFSFWEKRSDFVDGFLAFYFLPLLAFLVYSYYKRITHSKTGKHTFLTYFSMIPVTVVYLLLLLFFAMLGYHP
ncbi:hypothetical protein [Halobacillus hunanensis]|uniref:hypothetical protein n=1 Tax=Halobacillus hunanensis TaxID=578214 RepID=UPI0009A63373|nr:hypothetical protein [Halobacillus hunanensis]